MTAHHCPSFPCPICYPAYRYPAHYPGYYQAPAPKGCVCPAGAELTCQGFGCPRKGIGGNMVTCAALATEAGTAETPKSDSAEGKGAGPKDNAQGDQE